MFPEPLRSAQTVDFTLEPGGADPVVSAVVEPFDLNSVYEGVGQMCCFLSALFVMDTVVVMPFCQVIVPLPPPKAEAVVVPLPPVLPPQPPRLTVPAMFPLNEVHVNVGFFFAHAVPLIAPAASEAPKTRLVEPTNTVRRRMNYPLFSEIRVGPH
jgi:hypothetical protein